MEVGAQQVSGEMSGEESKGGKRLPGGNGGRSSRKKLKKVNTPGQRGARTGTCTCTETAGDTCTTCSRGQGGKVDQKAAEI